MKQDCENLTYQDVLERGEWLEDRGDYSRYWIGGEDSIWVNRADETIADPDEDDRETDDEDEDE